MVEMFREYVQQNGDFRRMLHEFQLMAAHLADCDSVRGHLLKALQRRNSDISDEHGLKAARREEVICQRRRRGLPLGAGNSDDFAGAQPQKQLRLGKYFRFFLRSELILDYHAGALQQQVVALCAVEVILAVDTGHVRNILLLHIRDGYLSAAAEPFQQRQPHPSLSAVSENGTAFSVKYWFQFVNVHFLLRVNI